MRNMVVNQSKPIKKFIHFASQTTSRGVKDKMHAQNRCIPSGATTNNFQSILGVFDSSSISSELAHSNHLAGLLALAMRRVDDDWLGSGSTVNIPSVILIS